MAKKRITFEADVVEGHKGVHAAIVPFDPEKNFGAPVRLHQRRHGWLVTGTLEGKKFDGFIGERWGRFFILVDGFRDGDVAVFSLAPTSDPKVWERAIESSKRTTQPGKARADARPFEDE